jgi:mannan endo-1,4-beta-mannosidase
MLAPFVLGWACACSGQRMCPTAQTDAPVVASARAGTAPTDRPASTGSAASIPAPPSAPASTARAISQPPGVLPFEHQSPVDTGNFDLRDVTLVDRDATAESVSLFAYLKNIARTHVMFGHQLTTALGFSVTRKDGTESDVYRAVGAFPAVFGFDALTITGQGETDYDAAKLMRAAYRNGGIITLSAHMHNFVGGGNFWDTTVAVPHVLPGGTHHGAFTAYLDQIADFALRLRDANGRPIPIVFRPFHENTGNWFWWGASFCSADEFRLLFRFTVEYLRDVRGVHSFLYAYSPSAHFSNENDYLARYPGDAYVDLLGVDGYDEDLSGNWIKLMMRDLGIVTRLAAKRGKVAALTETGPTAKGLRKTGNPNRNWYTERLLGALKRDRDARRIAYLLVWRNASVDHFWVPYRDHPELGNHELLDDFIRFFNDDYTVFGDQLKDVYGLSVRAARPPPLTYIATPMDRRRVADECEVRVKADGRGTKVESVSLSVQGAGEIDLPLSDGYHSLTWDAGRYPLGQPVALTVRSRYQGGLEQTARVTVKPSEKALRRFGFDRDLEGVTLDGTFAQAGTVQGSLRHSPLVGNGALLIDAKLTDDRVPDNGTRQAIWLGLPALGKIADLRSANKVRFDLLLPDSAPGRLRLDPGARLRLGSGQTREAVVRGPAAAGLPLVHFGSAAFRRYSAELDVSDVASATSMSIGVTAQDVDYQGPIYLDNVRLIHALADAPVDPKVVDTFEWYEESDAAVNEKYARNSSGNSVRLSLDRRFKHSGKHGLRYHYGLGTPDYAGVTRRLPNLDWSKVGQIEFWLKPDKRQQNLVIQVMAGGNAFEKWLPMQSLREGMVTLPLSALARPRWAPDAGKPIDLESLRSISAFSIYVNAEPGASLRAFESDLYFDDIRVSGPPTITH